MLEPATVEFTAAGPGSLRHGDRYHGPAGALAQARAVFLAGCALPQAWQGQACCTVLETGFGLGFNFLATWQAWRQDPARSRRLDFLSIERHPVALPDLARAHAAEPELAALARQLRMRLPPAIAGCHRIEFDDGQVGLTLVLGDGAAALAELDARADALFMDGFAPDRNPDLWSAAVVAELARLSRPGARLATWCATGALRRELAAHGFAVERLPGTDGKREITRAIRQGAAVAGADAGPSSALVLGAGVAGCQLSARLITRGWQVRLIDAAPGPAHGASGNAAGIVRPLLSRDDNRVTRWTRAAFLFALQAWRNDDGSLRAGWHPGGALQLARDERQLEQWRDALATLAFPGDHAQLVDADTTARLSGLAPGCGGVLFPTAGWAQPAVQCAETLTRCGSALQLHWSCEVAAIAEAGGGWQARDADGGLIAEAQHLVLATGAGPWRVSGAPAGADFQPPGHRPLQAVRGETTQFAGPALTGLELALCGDGYLAPTGQAQVMAGATYDDAGDSSTSAAGRAANLQHLLALTGLADGDVLAAGGRVAWRSVAPDRVPLAGADPGRRGIWHLRALASRGLVWAPLAAELLAADMSGQASPLARSLRGLLSVARPLLRQPPADGPAQTGNSSRAPSR